MRYRPRGFQQCALITRIARAGGVVNDEDLRRIVGPYATNVIQALADRRVIRALERERWALTDYGRELAIELLGELEAVRHG
jgi:hypothetical protein